MSEMEIYPHHCSVHREGADSLRVEGWNEDGSHEGTIRLTHATALDFIAVVSAELAKAPYAK
jgi:hypothetical protein